MPSSSIWTSVVRLAGAGACLPRISRTTWRRWISVNARDMLAGGVESDWEAGGAAALAPATLCGAEAPLAPAPLGGAEGTEALLAPAPLGGAEAHSRLLSRVRRSRHSRPVNLSPCRSNSVACLAWRLPP